MDHRNLVLWLMLLVLSLAIGMQAEQEERRENQGDTLNGSSALAQRGGDGGLWHQIAHELSVFNPLLAGRWLAFLHRRPLLSIAHGHVSVLFDCLRDVGVNCEVPLGGHPRVREDAWVWRSTPEKHFRPLPRAP
jgi:hypothetical protein